MTRGKAIRALERRRDYLVARLDGHGTATSADSFDLAEVAALEYALAVIDDAEEIGLDRLGRLSSHERDELRARLEATTRAA